MNKNNVKGLDTPGAITDSLTELLRQGTRGLIEKAVETELQFFLSQYKHVTDLKERKTVVRNGYLTERDVLTGPRSEAVKVPKVRDGSERGLSLTQPLFRLMCEKPNGLKRLCPGCIYTAFPRDTCRTPCQCCWGMKRKICRQRWWRRLKAQWSDDYLAWNRRDLDDEKMVYLWADGLYSTLRGEDDRLCLLILIGVNEQGEKRLLALSDGYRESKTSWVGFG